MSTKAAGLPISALAARDARVNDTMLIVFIEMLDDSVSKGWFARRRKPHILTRLFISENFDTRRSAAIDDRGLDSDETQGVAVAAFLSRH